MYRHIMVPLDGSKLAECVLPHVETIVKGCTAPSITLVSVIEPLHIYGGLESRINPDDRQQLDGDITTHAGAYLDEIGKQLSGIKVETKILHGRIADELAEFAEKNSVDLVIMATHGRSGPGRWVLGSVAERLLRTSCVPVLMVRAPGCVPGV